MSLPNEEDSNKILKFAFLLFLVTKWQEIQIFKMFFLLIG